MLLLTDSFLETLPAATPALAYTVLRNRVPLEAGFLVLALFLVDTFRRSAREDAFPIRAYGPDKRKVRRLNRDESTPSAVQDEVCLNVRPLASVKRAPFFWRPWSGLWIINAILAACVLDHMCTGLLVATADPVYSRQVSL